MKTIFIPAKSDFDISSLKKIKTKNLGLITTIQYLHKLKEIQKILPSSIIGGQILGCNISSAIKIKDKISSYLYIGTGEFHPIEVALKTNKEVLTFNPITKEFSKINKEDIVLLQKKQKAKLAKFYSSTKIGILVTTKPGQFHNKYLSLKEKLNLAKNIQEKLNKPSYIFLFNTLNENELENFPDIDIFINTACPRIEYKKIINLQDIPNL